MYALFKKYIVPNNILAIIFSQKLKPLEECDAISFYKYEKLKNELLDECLALYITLMVEGCELKLTLVDNGFVINIYFHEFLNQLKEKGVKIPPLDEATFRIKAYDSSWKKPLGIATIIVTTRVRTIAAKFQVIDFKLSYILLLGRH